MKPTAFVTAFILLALMQLGHAQTPPDQNSPPPGPLIVTQMPDFAQWTVDYTYSDAHKPGDPSALDRLEQAAQTDPSMAKALQDPQYVFTIKNIRPVHVLVTKTGSVMHEERQFEQSYQGEMWCDKEIIVEKRPNLNTLIAGLRTDQGKSAFPDFDWISRSNFFGIQAHDNVKCMGFQQKRYNIAGEYIGTAYAYVDIKTHYPEGFQYLVETRKYTFLKPPVDMQSIPEDFLAAAKVMKDRAQQAIPHLAPP